MRFFTNMQCEFLNHLRTKEKFYEILETFSEIMKTKIKIKNLIRNNISKMEKIFGKLTLYKKIT